MQNCPLAAVKLHAKQTRDGNNRRQSKGVEEEERDAGEETDGELDIINPTQILPLVSMFCFSLSLTRSYPSTQGILVKSSSQVKTYFCGSVKSVSGGTGEDVRSARTEEAPRLDGAIHHAAGPMLKKECALLHGCETGEAKITCGYRLPAKYVGFQEHLTHKLPNGPEDLLSALNAECPSMIPQPLSQQHPSNGELVKRVVQTTHRPRAHLCTDTHSCNPANLFPSQTFTPLLNTPRYNVVTHRGVRVLAKENERQHEIHSSHLPTLHLTSSPSVPIIISTKNNCPSVFFKERWKEIGRAEGILQDLSLPFVPKSGPEFKSCVRLAEHKLRPSAQRTS
ncbi:hypothetical protein PAMA_017258 [Pampus argenteus]